MCSFKLLVVSLAKMLTKNQQLSSRLHPRNKAEMLLLGEKLGELLVGGEVILLNGELGSGKTTLTRGIGRGLGIERGVRSPTFQLLREYPGRLKLHHADLYRIGGMAEADELGLDELPNRDGVLVVEWAERGFERSDSLSIQLEYAEPGRRLLLTGGPAHYRRLIERLLETWDS
jgi:tRNA threonylcarbamoyladenosine biosynthesis protein TsaE